MILFGASGHSLVIKEILEAENRFVTQYIDDDRTKKMYDGIPVTNDYSTLDLLREEVIISIGNNAIRKKVAESLNANFTNAFASTAFISENVFVGVGTVVFNHVSVMSKVKIGKHCILNNNCSVDHECDLSDYVHIAPGVTLCGNVKVGKLSMIGAGATVVQGIKIGNHVTIGAGAVILSDVPDHAVVVGNPGRIIKYNNE